ncbi:unnamed protein product [Pylaiella littoralis]
MRPTGGLIVVATAFAAAAKGVQAFVAPSCGSSASQLSSWRTGAAAASRQQQQQYTCSAVDNRRFRRASSRSPLPTGVTTAAAAEGRGGGGEPEGNPAPFASMEEGKRRWAAGARRSLARGAASLATFTVGATALSGLSADLQHRLNSGDDSSAATVVSIPTAMKSAQASVLKSFEKRTVEEKLGNLPAFMVTNRQGSPYLSPTRPNEPQLAVFFTNLADAKEMLREMVQSPTYVTDARILVVSMEKAYSMVKAGPRPTGYVRDDGFEEKMDFKLEQDMHSFAKARKLGLDVSPAAAKTAIPVFYAEGLEIKRDGGMVKPLFMDPADLVAAWNKAVKTNPEMPATPTVKVLNLPDVMVAMELTEEFNQFGFFASTESAEYIRTGRQTQKPAQKPRLGRMWAF